MPLNVLRFATLTVNAPGFEALQDVGPNTSRPVTHGENVLLTDVPLTDINPPVSPPPTKNVGGMR